MTTKDFDCVEMKRQIQERLREARSSQTLEAWNASVRAALRNDPHLRRFAKEEPHVPQQGLVSKNAPSSSA